MTAIGGYQVYAQPLIQEKIVQPNRKEDESSTGASSNVSKREELFKSLLKAGSEADSGASSAREGVRSEASGGRGAFVDITV